MGPLKKGDKFRVKRDYMRKVEHKGTQQLWRIAGNGNLVNMDGESFGPHEVEWVTGEDRDPACSCSICGGSGIVKDDRNKPLSCGACSFEISGSDGYWNSNLFNMKVEPNYRGTIKESYFVEAADGSVSIRGGLPEEVEASALERYIGAHRTVDEVQDLDSFNMSELTEAHRKTAHEAKRTSGVAKMAKVPRICSGQYKYSMFNKPADIAEWARTEKASGSVEDPALAGRRLCDLHSAYLFDQLTQNGQEVKELKVFASDGSRIPS